MGARSQFITATTAFAALAVALAVAFAVATSSKKRAKRTMPDVLWIHGLGDTGAGWEGAFGPLANKANFHHPTAPTQGVTFSGGERMTSWFDIVTWPIGLDEPEGPEGIDDDAVKAIHAKLDAMENSEKTILGGFSQGGTVAILAGLSYPKKLAGIVSISGWCAYRETMAEKVNEANKATPILLSVGKGDPIVTFPLTKKSGELLQSIQIAATGEDNVHVIHANRAGHPPGPSEMQAAGAFIMSQLGLS